MILLDANILLYAYIETLPKHRAISKWVEDLLASQSESVGVSWLAATAFLRISTNRKIFKVPSTIADATDRLDTLFAHPMVQVAAPTAQHWIVFSGLIRELGLSGDVLMDAHIAAMAIENNSAVASADKDFRRFSDYIKIIDPLKA